MVNVLNVAKKEFRDLCNSWLVLIILSVFILSIINSVYDFYIMVIVERVEMSEHLLNIVLGGVWYIITYYSMFVGIVIGVCSIANERDTNALSMLVTKPLFRDSIINGKILGALSFIVCVFLLAVVLFTAALFIVCGNVFYPILTNYLQSLPLIFFVAVAYVMIYFSMAMLVSILVRNQALAMILVFLCLFLFDIGRSANIAGALSAIMMDPGLQEKIATLSPIGISQNIQHCMFPPVSLPDGMRSPPAFMPWDQVINILFYLFILTIFNYLVFIRRDIS
jgi:ABC-2 type transport system permease protein